jgi:hypothetical protein
VTVIIYYPIVFLALCPPPIDTLDE